MSVAQQKSPLLGRCAKISWDSISTVANFFLHCRAKQRIS
jgi:hypothetical protein